MNISLNWLKQYIDLSGISADEISEKLTISGLEVENMVDKGKLYENFIVGFVKERKKHPNADKLSLCIVSSGETDYNVVCGAPNVQAGQKIVFAKIGAIVPDGGFKIAKTKIRGEVSEGMICSEKELGLSGDHSGIMVLDPSYKEGTPLAEALELNDVLYEIGITPNRSDALSHFGVARELAAIFNREFKAPVISLKESSEEITKTAAIEIVNTKNCPRYSSRVVKNVKIQESPKWLKDRLTSVGLRSINNVVDVTNFIMQEIGQPLHAFNLDKLSGKKIVVKDAGKIEKFTTLDSKERKLLPDTLMIWDGEKPVAVAGVMGGENSEVTPDTKNVLIESAYFNPSAIRKSAKNLQLSTDASYRYERGCDPNITAYAADRAAQLIAELSGGEILKGAIDVYPEKIKNKEADLRYDRIKKVLGYEIPKNDVQSIMTKLGMEIISKDDSKIRVKVPTFRPDIEREIDLIEEAARIYGYDKIPPVERIKVLLGEKIDDSKFRDDARNAAVGLGFYEMINNPLQAKDSVAFFGSPIEILNPQSYDMSALRTSMLSGILLTVSKNIKVGEKNLRLFEVGNVFEKKTSGEIKSFDDFVEEEKIIFVLTGKAVEAEWHAKDREYDIYDIKGCADAFLKKFSLDKETNDSYYREEDKFLNEKIIRKHKETVIGFGGSVKKEVLKKFDIDQNVYVYEFDLKELKKLRSKVYSYTELLKYPKAVRDCAFIIEKDVTSDKVAEALKKGGSKLLKKVAVFDVYEGENLGTNKKSLAFSLEYYDPSRTLTEAEVDEDFHNSINSVKKELNAELRGR